MYVIVCIYCMYISIYIDIQVMRICSRTIFVCSLALFEHVNMSPLGESLVAGCRRQICEYLESDQEALSRSCESQRSWSAPRDLGEYHHERTLFSRAHWESLVNTRNYPLCWPNYSGWWVIIIYPEMFLTLGDVLPMETPTKKHDLLLFEDV